MPDGSSSDGFGFSSAAVDSAQASDAGTGAAGSGSSGGGRRHRRRARSVVHLFVASEVASNAAERRCGLRVEQDGQDVGEVRVDRDAILVGLHQVGLRPPWWNRRRGRRQSPRRVTRSL